MINQTIKLSKLGYGCASLWASHLLNEKKAITLVRSAFSMGIHYFDTGPSYGCGLAETRLGKALKPIPRKEIILSSKAGTHCQNFRKKTKNFHADAVYQSVQDSLNRLQTDYLDILYLHGPEANDISNELMHTLNQLKKKNIIRKIGINSFNSHFIYHSLRYPEIDTYMIEYNVYCQKNIAVAKDLKQAKKLVVAGAALGRSLYTNNRYHIYRPKNLWYWLRSMKSDHQYTKVASQFEHYISEGYTPAQAALKYAITPKYIDCGVFNTTSISHLKENLSLLND